MARPLSELTRRLSKDTNAAASVKAARMLTEMRLAELRKFRNTTQTDVADVLEMKQSSIAQLEKRDDIYISTLRNYLQALGGELEIAVHFSDGTKVNISQFENKRL